MTKNSFMKTQPNISMENGLSSLNGHSLDDVQHNAKF